MKTPKWEQLINLPQKTPANHTYNGKMVVASALYISAEGTKHFYEALEILNDVYPDVYGEDFEELKKKEEANV